MGKILFPDESPMKQNQYRNIRVGESRYVGKQRENYQVAIYS